MESYEESSKSELFCGMLSNAEDDEGLGSFNDITRLFPLNVSFIYLFRSKLATRDVFPAGRDPLAKFAIETDIVS